MYFFYIIMRYTSIPVFLSTGALISHTYIYDHSRVLSRTARKQVIQTLEALVPSMSIELFRSFDAGFSYLITSNKVPISLRQLQYREITLINSLAAWKICMLSKTL